MLNQNSKLWQIHNELLMIYSTMRILSVAIDYNDTKNERLYLGYLQDFLVDNLHKSLNNLESIIMDMTNINIIDSESSSE